MGEGGGEIGNIESGKLFVLLSDFKCVLCIPHEKAEKADSERVFPCINLITTDHLNQLDASTIEACLDIKLTNCSDCRKFGPSQKVVETT